MDSPVDIVESALKEVDAARTSLAIGSARQITQAATLDYLKSVAYAWFKSHRPQLHGRVPATELGAVDDHFARVLDATDKASARTTYKQALNDAKAALIELRSGMLTAPGLRALSYLLRLISLD